MILTCVKILYRRLIIHFIRLKAVRFIISQCESKSNSQMQKIQKAGKSMFSFLKGKKKENSRAFRYEMAERISGKRIKYVTERINGTEEVIGKDGCISIKDDELIVSTYGKDCMRCKIEKMNACELLSKDGAVITAPDLTRGGEVHTVIAHYVYYR